MPERLRNALGGSAALLLGIAVFLYFCGWWVLIPTNISWLNSGDRAMHALGWFFYRDSPWGVPPGDSSRLGLELANSIGLADGLPLFAIPAKLLSPWLPRPFQYWGYWWLVCFALQSLFAYGFARQLGATRIVALFAAGFALITPAFLFRITLHMALAGHWIVLAALYLYARRDPPKLWMWPLLLTVAATVHIYLLAIAGTVWFASYVQRGWLHRLDRLKLYGEPVLIFLLTAVTLWTGGYFYTGSLGSNGFGQFRLNLLWPFITYGPWSVLLPQIPHGDFDYEGLSFLGIGIIALLVIGAVTGAFTALRVLLTARWLPLVVVALLMVLFALSNVVGVAGLELPAIPLPASLQALGNIFRSSGRFVWPLLYIITIGASVLLARRLRPGWAVPIIAVALVAQIWDTHNGLWRFRASVPPPGTTWSTPLVSPFWDRAAAAGYTRVRAIPVADYRAQDWQALETYAYLHNMGTDAIYLGRIDDTALSNLRAKDEAALATGSFEPRTLYVLDAAAARRAAQHLAPGDLLASIDGRIVFARDGAKLVDGLGIPPQGAAVG